MAVEFRLLVAANVGIWLLFAFFVSASIFTYVKLNDVTEDVDTAQRHNYEIIEGRMDAEGDEEGQQSNRKETDDFDF